MSIRRVTKDDAAALAALHHRCFSDAWSCTSFQSLLENDNTLALVAADHASLQTYEAFIVTRVAADEAEILTLGAEPSKRRMGLARALVIAASAEMHARGAKAIFLEVASDNIAAAALYTGIGFSAAGMRPRYYKDSSQMIDAKILSASLPLSL